MTRSRITGGIAGLATVVVFALLLVFLKAPPPGEAGAADQARPPRPPGKARTMPTHLVALTLNLGLKDASPTPWKGSVAVSEGRVVEVEILRGPARARVTGSEWTVRSFNRRRNMRTNLIRPQLRITLDAPPTAKVQVQTAQGKFDVNLADLKEEQPRNYLEGQVSAVSRSGSFRLTGPKTEDDFPALARGKDGTIWLAYVEYQPGKPLVNERVQAGHFDDLVPSGHGDCIRLVRFDGKIWHPAQDVTATGLDVWRPTVAVDGKGVVHVCWSQQIDGDWEIFTRRYTPGKDGKGKWSVIEQITRVPGSDFHTVSATDSSGQVWLAWQGWRKDNFEILLTQPGTRMEPQVISTSPANDWGPAIATSKAGDVYVAWDTYDQGNYDVLLHRAGRESKTWKVAHSPKFEARAVLYCDDANRVWIAYEEGDEQWGKDYANQQFARIGLKNNPGFALYINRTIQMKCLVDGKLMKPATQPTKAFQGVLRRSTSVPRLQGDSKGGLWLLCRHHILPGGGGEAWRSYALRYDGKKWTKPRPLPGSENIIDNRPALVISGDSVLAVYSGDKRRNTQGRDQDDLYASLLQPESKGQEPALVSDTPPAKPTVPPVHKNEVEDVARIRAYRVEAGGKKLHLLRGEFHRHTEYTSHRDQDGLLEDSWRYALDAGKLDWMGNGDHDNGFGHEYMWWQIQKVADLVHNPPHFVAAQTYERSNRYPNGHRNVMMPRRGIRPLPRGNLMGTEEKGTPDTKTLYAYLKHFGGICASHTSGTNMGTDWRDNDPLVEPIVEIYQGHRHNYEHKGAPRSATQATNIGGYQPAGTIWNAFEKGIRFGFQSSSDHVSTHMSYAIALTDDTSRQGLIDAFKKRHCYAATDNIILDVRSGEHLMGDAFTTKDRPTLEVKVKGTGPIAKVHIIRDNAYVYSKEVKGDEVKLTYTDMDATRGKARYYYVRIEQADGNLAWGSPMWITWKP
jgi:hypothetical protein